MSAGNGPKSQRKIFVGGLNLKTTEDTFRDHFSQFGELVDSVVMTDPYSKKSRGFGFIEYATLEEVDACQGARPHTLDGKEVETKRAVPRDKFSSPDAGQSVKKIFVGGLKELEESDLETYFAQFGSVASVSVMTDKATGKKRGFGFIEFEDYDIVDRIILKGEHHVNGTRIEVRKAIDKKDMNGAGGGRGGGRGGKPGGYGGDSGGYGSGGYGQQGGYGGAGGYGGGQGGFGGQGGGFGGGQQGGFSGAGGYLQGGFGGGYGQGEQGGYGSMGGGGGGGYGSMGGGGGGYGGQQQGGFGGYGQGQGQSQGQGGADGGFGQSSRGFGGGGPMRNGGAGGRGGRGSPYNGGGGRGRGGR